MSGIVRISACPQGVIHLSVGAVTVHLDREVFQILTEECQRYSRKEEAQHTIRTPVLKIID